MKSCKVIHCFWFSMVLAFSSSAQRKDSLTLDMIVPQQAIKFSPMHLINFYPTIELSFEQKIAPLLTLQAEGGYVLDYNEQNKDFLNKRGAKVKLETRYYFSGRAEKGTLYYLSGEVYGNFVNFDRLSSREECFDLNCDHTFIRNEPYAMKYREKGLSLKVGLMKCVGKFILDFNSGWTIRDIEYREPATVPESFNEDWSLFDIPNERDRIAFSPNLGIRFGYRIR